MDWFRVSGIICSCIVGCFIGFWLAKKTDEYLEKRKKEKRKNDSKI